MSFDGELAARIRAMLAAHEDISERRMFGGLTFLRAGRMCCGIVGRDLMVRVMDDDMALVLRQPHVRPMDFTGQPLRGFVYVAPQAIAADDQLREWVARGLAFTEREANADRGGSRSSGRSRRRPGARR